MPNAPDPGERATAGTQIERLVEIMRVLRSPTGCPWDREQTLASLRPFVLEEAYEVLDAIDETDRDRLQDELGDLVFEAVFVAQICAEEGHFTLADALGSAADKIIRRHPHVFDPRDETGRRRDGTATTTAEVRQQWEVIKAQEQQAEGREPSVLGNLPAALPSLLRAYRLGRRAATVGFDWSDADEVMNKVDEELRELRDAIRERDRSAIEEELGDLLFAVVNLARHVSIEPEGALRLATQKFSRRFHELERRYAERGVALREVPLDELEAEWQRLKAEPTT